MKRFTLRRIILVKYFIVGNLLAQQLSLTNRLEIFAEVINADEGTTTDISANSMSVRWDENDNIIYQE